MSPEPEIITPDNAPQLLEFITTIMEQKRGSQSEELISPQEAREIALTRIFSKKSQDEIINLGYLWAAVEMYSLLRQLILAEDLQDLSQYRESLKDLAQEIGAIGKKGQPSKSKR